MERYPPTQEEVRVAFEKALNAMRGTHYKVVARPDKAERERAEVDYVMRDDAATPPEIAVEVSSTWRSEGAGKEDADWWRWVQILREKVRGRLPGRFRLSTPMRIPPGLTVEPFATTLMEVLHRERERLVQLHREGKGDRFNVCGISAFVSYAGEGNDIDFGRMLTEEDGRELPEQVKRLLAKRSPKLKGHKEAARETWLVVYNTFWPAMSPAEVRDIVLSALGPEHAHIDHFGVIAGDPPDDAWLDIIR